MSLKNNGEGVRQHRTAPSSGSTGIPAFAFHGLHGVSNSRKAQSPKSASCPFMATKAFTYLWGGNAKGDAAAAAALRDRQHSAPTASFPYRTGNCGAEAVRGACGVSASISSSPARRWSSSNLQLVSCTKADGAEHLPTVASGLARKEAHGGEQRTDLYGTTQANEIEAGVPNSQLLGAKRRDEAQDLAGFPDGLMAAIQLLAFSANGETNMEIVAHQEVAGAGDDVDEEFAECFPITLKEVQNAVEILQDHMHDQNVSASATVCNMSEEAPKSTLSKNRDDQEGWWGLSFSDDEDGGDDSGGIVEDITMELMQLGLEQGVAEEDDLLEDEDRPALLEDVPRFNGKMAEELATLLSAMRQQQHHTQSTVDSNGASFQSETVTYNNSETDWWDAMSSVYKAMFNRVHTNRAVLKGLKV